MGPDLNQHSWQARLHVRKSESQERKGDMGKEEQRKQTLKGIEETINFSKTSGPDGLACGRVGCLR